MSARNARLKLNAGGFGSTVEVEGHKIPGVRGINITANIMEMPKLTLDLVFREMEVEGEMVVLLPLKTREALIALGWTPPADDDDAIVDQGVIDVDPAPLIAYNDARRKP
jgi:hypothetical protein